MLKQSLVITGRSEIESILKSCTTCRIAMISDGKPYVVPMVFGYRWDSEGLFLYFHSGLRGRKIEALRKDPRLCFEMDIEGELMGSGSVANRYSRAFSSIVGEGEVIFAGTLEERKAGFAYIMEHQTGRRNFTYENAYVSVTEVLRLRVTQFKATRKSLPARPMVSYEDYRDPQQELCGPGEPVFTEDDG